MYVLCSASGYSSLPFTAGWLLQCDCAMPAPPQQDCLLNYSSCLVRAVINHLYLRYLPDILRPLLLCFLNIWKLRFHNTVQFSKCMLPSPPFVFQRTNYWAVLKRVPSAERSVMRSVLRHTKTRAAYACGASHRALNQMDDFVAV